MRKNSNRQDEERSGRNHHQKKTDITIIENFYRKLYSTSVSKLDHMANRSRKNILNVGSEEIPEIDKNELRTALKKMKNKKTEKTE